MNGKRVACSAPFPEKIQKGGEQTIVHRGRKLGEGMQAPSTPEKGNRAGSFGSLLERLY